MISAPQGRHCQVGRTEMWYNTHNIVVSVQEGSADSMGSGVTCFLRLNLEE